MRGSWIALALCLLGAAITVVSAMLLGGDGWWFLTLIAVAIAASSVRARWGDPGEWVMPFIVAVAVGIVATAFWPHDSAAFLVAAVGVLTVVTGSLLMRHQNLSREPAARPLTAR